MKTLVIATLFASLTFAQGPTPGAMQPRTPEELKTALTLTDSQITSLQQLQQQRMTANRAIFEQIGEKQQALDTLLKTTAPDATALGRLMLEVKALRAQIGTSDDRFQQQALGLLTTDQRTKLKGLEDSMKLQPAAHQAIGLNLLDPPAAPEGSFPRMPGPGAGPGGPGPAFGGGPEGMMLRMRSPKR